VIIKWLKKYGSKPTEMSRLLSRNTLKPQKVPEMNKVKDVHRF